jgi:lysine 2,3-aminomutase
VPTFVIDAPGGGGKVPINPEYILCRNAGRVLIRNFKGDIFEYPETAAGLPCGQPPKKMVKPDLV